MNIVTSTKRKNIRSWCSENGIYRNDEELPKDQSVARCKYRIHSPICTAIQWCCDAATAIFGFVKNRLYVGVYGVMEIGKPYFMSAFFNEYYRRNYRCIYVDHCDLLDELLVLSCWEDLDRCRTQLKYYSQIHLLFEYSASPGVQQVRDIQLFMDNFVISTRRIPPDQKQRSSAENRKNYLSERKLSTYLLSRSDNCDIGGKQTTKHKIVFALMNLILIGSPSQEAWVGASLEVKSVVVWIWLACYKGIYRFLFVRCYLKYLALLYRKDWLYE